MNCSQPENKIHIQQCFYSPSQGRSMIKSGVVWVLKMSAILRKEALLIFKAQ